MRISHLDHMTLCVSTCISHSISPADHSSSADPKGAPKQPAHSNGSQLEGPQASLSAQLAAGDAGTANSKTSAVLAGMLWCRVLLLLLLLLLLHQLSFTGICQLL